FVFLFFAYTARLRSRLFPCTTLFRSLRRLAGRDWRFDRESDPEKEVRGEPVSGENGRDRPELRVAHAAIPDRCIDLEGAGQPDPCAPQVGRALEQRLRSPRARVGGKGEDHSENACGLAHAFDADWRVLL